MLMDSYRGMEGDCKMRSERLWLKVDGCLMMMERLKSSEEQDRGSMIHPRNNDNKMLLNSVLGCPQRKGRSPQGSWMNHKMIILDRDPFKFHINHLYICNGHSGSWLIEKV